MAISGRTCLLTSDQSLIGHIGHIVRSASDEMLMDKGVGGGGGGGVHWWCDVLMKI